MTFSVGIMAVCTILIIPVIIHKLFIPFCLLKFIKSVFINTIYALFMSIPYQITDESDRFEILRNNRIAVVSSGIFANLLGGFISQKFGTIALYAFNVIAFIPLIPAIIFLIPTNIGNGKVPDTIKNKIPMKTFGKFIFSIPMLAFFILLCLPLLITKSYYSFLFPIFMNAMDMPNMYITNLYVIAQTILLIISEPIKQITRNTDFWKLTILGMFIMGLAYLCFQLNSTILWIISVLIITSILGETVASFVDILWPRQAKVFGLDPESVNSLILILYNSIESIKEGIISIFLGFGNSEACIGIGGCCVVFTMLFALLSRKSALAKSSGQE